MREIKFRAWHAGFPLIRASRNQKIKPKMLYDEKPGDCLVYKSQGQPVIVMQFTGLKDKHGKEIYEGDILRPIIINGTITDGIVKFISGCFYVEQIGAERLDDCLVNKIGYEVIGNIYENPELVGV